MFLAYLLNTRNIMSSETPVIKNYMSEKMSTKQSALNIVY